MEISTELLIAGCKEAAQHPEGIALYKVGKNPGLFTAKTGIPGDTAQYALQSGYLELLRTEGKAETVRLTERGAAFLREHLDPKPTLEELLTQLRTHQGTMPRWLAEIDAQFAAFRLRSLNFLEQQGAELNKLIERTEAALRRLQAGQLPALNATLEPWQVEALVAVDAATPWMGLAEIYHHLEQRGFRSLTIPDYQHGILLLRDRGAVKLIPESDMPGPMLEPEYALIDEGKIYVGVGRG
ncbi:MAG: hypothetical protein U0796_05605 [Gemmatales bacterium]